MTTVLEMAKAVHALDLPATSIGRLLGYYDLIPTSVAVVLHKCFRNCCLNAPMPRCPTYARSGAQLHFLPA
jgi:hypothetical protein